MFSWDNTGPGLKLPGGSKKKKMSQATLLVQIADCYSMDVNQ